MMKRFLILPALLILAWVMSLAVGQPAGTVISAPLSLTPTPVTSTHTQEQADELYARAITLYQQGDTQGAAELFEQALPLFRSTGDRKSEAVTLGNLGLMYKRLARFDDALAIYQQALTLIRDLGDQRGIATILDNIGSVYLSLGQYTPALDYYQQGRVIWEALGDRSGKAVVLSNIALVLRKQGNYAQALDLYWQSLALIREARDTASEGTLLNNIADVYVALQQKEQALDFFQQALAIIEKTNKRAEEALTLANIGLIHSDQGRYDQAIDAYQKALALQRRLRDRAGEANTLSKLGTVYRRQGQNEQARQMLEQALMIQQSIGARPEQAQTLNALGLLYDRQGNYEQALTYYRQALALHREVGNPAGEATNLANVGYILERQGQLQQALEAYLQSIDIEESVRGLSRIEEFKSSVAERAASSYEQAILLLVKLQQPERAFELSEHARARSFLDQLGNKRLDIHASADTTLLQEEQSLRHRLAALESALKQTSEPKANVNLKQQIMASQQAYTLLISRLKLSNPEYAALVSISPTSLADLQRSLDTSTTLLSYYVAEKSTLAFILTKSELRVIELAPGRQSLNDAVTEFRSDPPLSSSPPSSARQLYAWLIAPLKVELKTPLLGIVPHGTLHYLPFAALGDGQQYLGESYTLFTLPSAGAMPYIQQKRKDGPPDVLALAQSQPAGLPALQYADDEVAMIAHLYPETAQVLAGSDASEAALQKLAGTRRIIHLAAHGQLNTASPLFSRIVLGAAEEADGSLEVHEVYQLNLQRADLVVLSACQTQLGAQSRGDDIISLHRSFIYAGAASVIASLWRVDDKATSLLMQAFYTNLQQGKSKAEALQAAQAQLRTDPKYAHPYFWAAFVLTGDPGQSNSTGTNPASIGTSFPQVLSVIVILLVLSGSACLLLLWRRRGIRMFDSKRQHKSR